LILIASMRLITCLKIGCPTNFISVFLSMLLRLLRKTNLQHGVKPSGSNPIFYYFIPRSVVIKYTGKKLFPDMQKI
jgi:hypothetical protein